MSEETKVVWEKESDVDLARSFGQLSNSVMHTIKNNQEVRKALEDGQSVFFKLESERLHAELDNGTRLTREFDFYGRPDATIMAVQDGKNQVSLAFDEKTREQIKSHSSDQGRSR